MLGNCGDFSIMRVSTNNYRDATRLCSGLTAALYGVAGILLAYSARRLALPPTFYMLAIAGAILAANAIIYGLQKVTLPKAETQLAKVIADQNGGLFINTILRREMARLIQPLGGLAFTIGFLAAIIALRFLR
jgi:uncharacterized membrane protein YgdD (TMEM256/DUF423 family)